MIHAVSDSCSVRWTKVNRQVYKFQSLVFKDGDKPLELVKAPEKLDASNSQSLPNTSNRVVSNSPPLPHASSKVVSDSPSLPHTSDRIVSNSPPLPHSSDIVVSDSLPLPHTPNTVSSDSPPLPNSSDRVISDSPPLPNTSDRAVFDSPPLPHTSNRAVSDSPTVSHTYDRVISDSPLLPNTSDNGIVYDSPPLPHTSDAVVFESLPSFQTSDAVVSDSPPLPYTSDRLDRAVSNSPPLPHSSDRVVSNSPPLPHTSDAVVFDSRPSLQTSDRGPAVITCAHEVQPKITVEDICPVDESLKSILTKSTAEQPGTKGWRSVYGEYLGPSHVTTKRNRLPSAEEEDSGCIMEESACARRGQRRVRFQEDDKSSVQGLLCDEEDGRGSNLTCWTCQQVVTTDTTPYQELMEKSKEELAKMVVRLHVDLEQRRKQQNQEIGSQPNEQETKMKSGPKQSAASSKLKIHKNRSKSPKKKRIVSV